MNYLKSVAFCVLLSICFISSNAQNNLPTSEPDYNKPRLFSDLPDRFAINVSDLEALFSLSVGQTVSTHLSPVFLFKGTVVSKSEPADTNVKSVIIKSSNRLGATFGVSKSRNDDGSFTYRGRMVSYNHSDAFEITWDANQYVLLKKHTLKIVNE